MHIMAGKRLFALGCFVLVFFWETLSHFSKQGSFCTSCYQEDSQTFLLLAPPILMIWLFRHHLFVGVDRKPDPALSEEERP